jgi:molecular chaperone IbpA
MFKIQTSSTPLFSQNTIDKIDHAFDTTTNQLGRVIDNVFNILEHPEFPFLSLEAPTSNGRGFPPYNIIEQENGQVRLDVAVAGYTKNRLKVELEGNALNIKGSPWEGMSAQTPMDEKGKVIAGTYRKQGISNASFVRSFSVQPTTIVNEVLLKDGILSIFLSNKKPEPTNKTTFEIK